MRSNDCGQNARWNLQNFANAKAESAVVEPGEEGFYWSPSCKAALHGFLTGSLTVVRSTSNSN